MIWDNWRSRSLCYLSNWISYDSSGGPNCATTPAIATPSASTKTTTPIIATSVAPATTSSTATTTTSGPQWKITKRLHTTTSKNHLKLIQLQQESWHDSNMKIDILQLLDSERNWIDKQPYWRSTVLGKREWLHSTEGWKHLSIIVQKSTMPAQKKQWMIH